LGDWWILRRRIPAPRGDYAATIREVRNLVSTIENELGHRGSVGIATPGALSPQTGLVKNANSTWLIGRRLDRDLERALGRPVRRAASNRRRAGPQSRPWPRDQERPGPQCYCGRTGCIETFVSGPALSATYAALDQKGVDASEIAARADAGDPLAARALDLYEERLARALASMINVLDPDVIVLGGGLSNIGRLYVNVPSLWRPFVFSDSADTPLVRARHGDSSGVRGAAWLWRDSNEGPT
jgi:fructokinase